MNGELKGKKITSRVIVLKHEKRIATSLKIKIQNYPQRTYLLKYVRNRECIIVHLNRSGTKQTSFCLVFFHQLSLLSSFIPLVSHSYSLGSLQRNQTTKPLSQILLLREPRISKLAAVVLKSGLPGCSLQVWWG